MTAPPLPRDMVRVFAVAVALMFLHKVECFLTAEWTVSPFFQWLISLGPRFGSTPEEVLGAAIFLVFVTWLFLGLAMGLLVLRGGWGPHIALGIWGLTYILEWHHVARSLAAGGYYSGLITAVAYLAWGVVYWRTLLSPLRSRGLVPGTSTR